MVDILGQELGFYCGCAMTWLSLSQRYPDRFSARVGSITEVRASPVFEICQVWMHIMSVSLLFCVQTLLGLIRRFPIHSPRDQSTKHALQLIRYDCAAL